METNPDGKRLQEDLFCDSRCICREFKEQVLPSVFGLCQTQRPRYKSVRCGARDLK